MKNYKFIKKKGFTIVELVIVIGVIGILSAILIPTFISIADKAKKSNDQALIRNLNNAVAIGKADGQTFDTFDDALEYVEDYGYNARNIKPQAGGEILWDTTIQDFALIENISSITDGYKYFKAYESIPELDEQFFSIYLSNSELTLDDVTVKVGFDAGKNTNISAITYEQNVEEQEVIIRTLGECNITVNAPLDRIHHYGNSKFISINEVSPTSFYEHGSSEITSIASGRVVLFPRSGVNELFIKGNNAILAKTEDVIFPKITRSNAVTSTSIQIVDNRGEPQSESSIAISGSTVTPTGDVPEDVMDDVCDGLTKATTEHSEKMALKYCFRVGEDVDGDESNYCNTIIEALTLSGASGTAITIYLLKDYTTTSKITLNKAQGAVNTLDLQGYSIRGINCTPLYITFTANFNIINGSIIGDSTHPAIDYKHTTNSKYVTLTNVNTVGGIKNSSAAKYTSYYRINGGTHTLCSLTGKLVISATKNTTTYFDCDPSSYLNSIRCDLTKTGDLWGVSSKPQDSTKPIYNTNDANTYYSSVQEAMDNDDFPVISIRLNTNVIATEYTENDVNSTTTKTLTFAGGTSKAKRKFIGSIKSSGALTTTYGTFELSDTNVTTLTVSTGSNVTINSGTITTLTANKGSTNLYFKGGSLTKELKITSTVSAKVYISGGTITGKATISGTGTSYKLEVTGGTFTAGEVFDSYELKIKSGYSGVPNGDGTITVKKNA